MRCPNPMPTSPVQGFSARKSGPATACFENEQWFHPIPVRLKADGNLDILLRVCAQTRFLTGTHPKFQWQNSSSKGTRGTGRNRVVWLQIEGCLCPCIESSSFAACRGMRCQTWICINLVNTISPTLLTPWDPTSPNSHNAWGSFSGWALMTGGNQPLGALWH